MPMMDDARAMSIAELKALAGARAGRASGAAPPPARERPAALPLSFAQRRLWFLERLGLLGCAYNSTTGLRLDGPLDAATMERSFVELVRRHESLRTRFVDTGPDVVQVVDGEAGFVLERRDLSGLAPDGREAAVDALALEMASRSFDLETGPLIRASLVRLAPEEHVLLISMHHIVCDAWSFGILFRDLGLLYSALSQGRAPELPTLRMQYPDFALRQREQADLHADDRADDRHLAFWKRHLLGAPEVLNLPTDRPRPRTASYRGAWLNFDLPQDLSGRIRALARKEGATPFMFLLAAFSLLLTRLSGQGSVVIGSPVAGRTLRETEDLIGFFVNSLPLHVDVSGEPDFRELLARVRDVTLDAYDHQDLPFERLVEALDPARDLSRHPLFQALFSFQNAPREALGIPGVRTRGFNVDNGTSKFDLTLIAYDAGADDALRGTFEYAADLFDADTIRRLSGCWRTLLEGIIADPGRPVSDLPLLGAEEQDRILARWNDTGAEYPRGKCLRDLFSDQAARTPDATALVWKGKEITYAEVERRSNQVGHRLRGLGVGPDTVVGLCLERSPEMVIGLLGILKAGGAYLPLDPKYPPERTGFMVEDAKSPVIVTQASLADGLAARGAALLLMDRDWPEIARQPEGKPEVATHPENLAFVIYTSGSTGRPKGVAMPNGALVNLIAWQIAEAGSERVMQFTSISFDVSFQEIFTALLSGRAIVLIDEDVRLNVPDFVQSMIDDRGESVFAPQMQLDWMAQEVLRRQLPDFPLKRYFQAGEALRLTPAIRELFGRHQGARLFNLYGPTETHVVTSYPLPHDLSGEAYLPPIGKPIWNTRLYVLDKHMRPVPQGVAGDLYVGGVALARGYLNRPGLTAERFVPDPFGHGDRLYRTGDLARWRADGNLEFLGRVDHQVKIRGFRIELGEIEACLQSFPAVRQGVAVAREDAPGGKRIVAYVVGDRPGAIDPAALRAHLKEALPDYMIPAAIMVLDELPLSPNKKVDRMALPAPEGRQDIGEYVAPRTPTEEALAGLWMEVLKLDRVGVRDDFFDLGGHSLLATRIVARIQEALAPGFPLRALFDAPTIEDLATRIEALRREPSPDREAPSALAPRPRDGVLPLSFAQERVWFLEQLGFAGSSFNLPVAMRIEGPLDEEAMRRSLDDLARHQEALRTQIVTVDGGGAMRIGRPQPVPVEVHDLSRLPEVDRDRERRRLVQEEVFGPFDLERGPLLRAMLLSLGTDDHMLVLTMHHIVSDGWSMEVLCRDLKRLYDARRQGREAVLASLPVQYADYAVWQREWLERGELERQMAYWRKQLADLPAGLDLPLDRPRPSIPSYRGARRRATLPAGLSSAIRGLAGSEGATPFMVLLAAFQLLLSRWTGQTDIVVGSPIAGRTHRELEGLVGFFVNTLVLRTDLSGEPTFRSLLQRVKDVALDAYSHQDVPFGKLVEELQPVRDLSRTPIVEAVLNWLNFTGSGKDEEDAFLEVDTDVFSKFDLTIYARERGDGIELDLVYNAEIFHEERAAILLDQLASILEQATADAGRPIGCYSLGATPVPAPAPIEAEWHGRACDRLALWARRSPSLPAVSDDRETLSYAELEAASDRLARHLAARGIGRNDVVAVLARRAAVLPWAVLGIQKAGAAFALLDPGHPPLRLARMLESLPPCGLIALAPIPPELDGPGNTLWRIDLSGLTVRSAADSLQDAPDALLPSDTTPGDMAYGVFTSGTTGTPRLVAAPHGALSHFLHWQAETFGLDAGDRFAMLSGLGHDPLIRDLFAPLWSGGRLCIPAPELLRRGGLAEWCAATEVSVVHVTPPLWEMMAGEDAGPLPRLRRVFFGGDVLGGKHVSMLARMAPDAVGINFYGATETPQAMGHAIIEGTDLADGSSVPIGRGIEGVEILVLDAGGAVAGIGEVGEIFIRTPYLSLGYLGNPSATAEKFVPSPFGHGERLYATGDLGRRRPDGQVEFRGRADRQAKLRGFRVEYGEIEARLLDHPGVAQAFVTSRENADGDARLVAYVAGGAGGPPDADELRAFLRALLPDYLVPAVFVPLDRLPLTPNGKIDHRALPEPADGPGDDGYEPPSTETERLMAGLWEESLGLDRVGIHDNFFDLGGHSLLAARLIARIRSRFGVDLPLSALFEAPSVADLSREVDLMLEEEEAGDASSPDPEFLAT
jgi:amino acid adenylation domain-containing protein